MFDRDDEWSALVRFVTSEQPGATLGVVSGRRRQGKTFLLDALCREAGGFYFAAEEAAEAESLRYLGAEVAAFLDAPLRCTSPTGARRLTRCCRWAVIARSLSFPCRSR